MNKLPNQRYHDFQVWLSQVCKEPILELAPLLGDASFRRYFRLRLASGSVIAVDAPPEKEDSARFVEIAALFAGLGLAVPQVLAMDLARGFLLVTDLGDQLYWNILNAETADALYRSALQALLMLQACTRVKAQALPAFERTLLRWELDQFREWYLERHLGLELQAQEVKLLEEVYTLLLNSALAQPQICVHRDYHSRNLLRLPEGRVGIVDFQDAVWGPVTYDLVSLLRDCYIDWPAGQVQAWIDIYYVGAREAKLPVGESREQFGRWLDWMGMQRHLKAVFIFARKLHRDGVQSYLQYIPRALGYVEQVCAQYPEFAAWQMFLEQRLLPRQREVDSLVQEIEKT